MQENHIYIEEIGQHNGQPITIKGWLYNKRSSGKIFFLIIRDGTGLVQAVAVKGQIPDTMFSLFESLTQESSLIVTGIVRAEPRSPGGFELTLSSIQVVQLAQTYPISLKSHGSAFLLDHRHLWIRSSRQHSILRIRATLVRLARKFFDDKGFTLIDTPIFTPSACEGTTTLFSTDYFGEIAHLTQSGQLYGEAACMAFGKIYCFGPTFRAELSKTRRHLTEFWMIEPEVAYAELEDIILLAESFVTFLIQGVLKERKKELQLLERDLSSLEKIVPPFPRLMYEEAAQILKKESPTFHYGEDFGGGDETILSKKFEKPLFVTHYPSRIKAFYMKRPTERLDLTYSVDLLASEGYGEIIGGGQREDSYEELVRRIQEYGLQEKDFKWYLDLRRYGSIPHAGFGLGIERTLAWICGLSHVRETIPFPRMIHRLQP